MVGWKYIKNRVNLSHYFYWLEPYLTIVASLKVLSFGYNLTINRADFIFRIAVLCHKHLPLVSRMVISSSSCSFLIVPGSPDQMSSGHTGELSIR
jgi:hypothetical protein